MQKTDNIRYVIVHNGQIVNYTKAKKPDSLLYGCLDNFTDINIEQCSYPSIKKARIIRKFIIQKYIDFFRTNEDCRKIVGYETKTDKEYLDYLFTRAELFFVTKQVKCSYEILDTFTYN